MRTHHARRRKSFSTLLACLVVTISGQCLAGTGSGTINPGWTTYGDGIVLFYLSGPHTSPQCPLIPDRWAFDTTTPAGKSMFATFLLAYTTGRSVTVYGSGAPCIHSNTEPVLWIAVND